MLRIAVAIALIGTLSACSQPADAPEQAQAGASLDFIDAVPISRDEPLPVARAEPAARKQEPPEKAEEAEAPSTPSEVSAPAESATRPSETAEAATRRANETPATIEAKPGEDPAQ